MVQGKLVKVDGEWVREAPGEPPSKSKKEMRQQKAVDDRLRRQEMDFLSKGLMPPSELKSFLDRTQDESRGGRALGPGKKQGHLLRIKGASCIGNSTTDEHVATVVSRSKAMIVELRGIDARLTVLGQKPSRDDAVLREEQKLVKKRHLLKTRLDRTVQTLQIAEHKVLTVPISTIGAVLWATFGAPGKDQSDVTDAVERSVQKGGIDGLSVNLQTLGAQPLPNGGCTRVLSIIYIGKAHQPVMNKVHLGFAWTPRMDAATPRSGHPEATPGVEASRNLQEFAFEDLADSFLVPEREEEAPAAKGGMEGWLGPLSDMNDQLMSALCFIAPDSRMQRQIQYYDDEEESDWDEEEEGDELAPGAGAGGEVNLGSWFSKDHGRSADLG